MSFPIQICARAHWRHGLVILFFAMGVVIATAAGKTDLTGHYELAGANLDHAFSLDVTQTGAKAELSFSAGMADGSGAAPDGDGKGEVAADGVLTFKFTDSFGNEGTGTLVGAKGNYHLNLNVTTVVEPRPLRFYGDVELKKTSSKPAS